MNSGKHRFQAMERLTSFLITGDIERQVLKFQNGGFVCLDEGPEAGFPGSRFHENG